MEAVKKQEEGLTIALAELEIGTAKDRTREAVSSLEVLADSLENDADAGACADMLRLTASALLQSIEEEWRAIERLKTLPSIKSTDDKR